MKPSLIIALSTLIMGGPALAETVKTDPNAITCLVRPVEGMAEVKDRVCKRNWEWGLMNGGARFAGSSTEGGNGPPPMLSQPPQR